MPNLSFLRYALGANYSRFNKRIKDLAEKENRSALALKADFLMCFLRKGFGLSDYFDYELWKKSWTERKEYASIKDEDVFYAFVSPEEYKKFFTIKYDFLKNFSKYIKREFIVPTADNREECFAYFEKHPTMMVKPYDGLGGMGVHRINVNDEGGPEKLYKKMVDEHLFAEEVIPQHEELNRMSPNSVNTLRVITSNIDGVAKIKFIGFRCGAGADVDNFHAGGVACDVDLDTGKLKGNALSKALDEYEYHPITGVKFDGFQIPYFEEVKQLCLDASYVNTNIHVVGWDVAVTPDGPTFVEGNRRPGFDVTQVVSRRGRMDIIRSATEELKDYYKRTGKNG